VESGGLARTAFVLPRDTREPGRYDYVYWPRWFAGFRYVLLSSAEVRGHLAREDARAPRHFYTALESSGKLVAEWGEGSDLGFRLYELPPGGDWARPLTAEDLAEVRGSPRVGWFLSSLGSLYAGSGDLATAELLFRTGCAWDSASVPLRCNLGGVYARQGRLPEAAALFEEGLHRDPRSFELLYNFGQVCRRAGLHSRAEDLLRRAVDLRPEYAPVHYELARAFLAQEKKRLAMMALEHYVRLERPSPARAEAEALLRQLRSRSRGRDGGNTPSDTVATPAAGTVG
jgi:tetratricopeptide (TPR) repeat protein